MNPDSVSNPGTEPDKEEHLYEDGRAFLVGFAAFGVFSVLFRVSGFLEQLRFFYGFFWDMYAVVLGE